MTDRYFTGTIVRPKPTHLSQERPTLSWWKLVAALGVVLLGAYVIGGMLLALGVLAIRAGAI